MPVQCACTASILRGIARQAMRDYGLLPDFSPDVLAEVKRVAQMPDLARFSSGSQHAGHPAGRRARPPRPALVLDRQRRLARPRPAGGLPGLTITGATRILVAIADVDALVAPGGAIDAHAGHNTTSVYTPALIFPMLPERLSTDLTSLAFDRTAAAMVVDMVVDEDGTVGDAEVYRALVRNHAKLAYTSVAAWLDGDGPPPDRARGGAGARRQLRLQDRIAQRAAPVAPGARARSSSRPSRRAPSSTATR